MHADAEESSDNETQFILTQLRKLDLATYPVERATQLVSQLGWYYADLPIRAGVVILRARLNEDGKSFNSKGQLTYAPREMSTGYNRASIPDSTMFYAALEPGDQERDRFYPAIVTCTCEILQEWFENKKLVQPKALTYGYWRVIEDLHLCAVVQSKAFGSSNPPVRLIVEHLNLDSQSLDPRKDEAFLVSAFFADEFAKKVRNDYEYILSATFTQRMIRNEMDGILYPSVCLDGRGFNIAISPGAADAKIRLVAVRESLVYKNSDRFEIRDRAAVEVSPNQDSFNLGANPR